LLVKIWGWFCLFWYG